MIPNSSQRAPTSVSRLPMLAIGSRIRRRHLGLTSADATARAGGCEAGSRALGDELALELGKGGEDGPVDALKSDFVSIPLDAEVGGTEVRSAVGHPRQVACRSQPSPVRRTPSSKEPPTPSVQDDPSSGGYFVTVRVVRMPAR